jgi:DNA-binding NarL/FixJ family response regulator
MRDQPTRRRGPSGIAIVPPIPGEGKASAHLRLERNAHAGRRKKQRLSVALIDPKPLTRRSLAEMLAKALPDYAMVVASSCEELLEVEGRSSGSLRLVIVYIRSAGIVGTSMQDALHLVRRQLPESLLIVLSDRDDIDDVNQALSCGVRGYIPTSAECEVAFAALRLVNAGGTFVPADALRSATAKEDVSLEGERRGPSHPLDLTPRELSVVDLLREGKPNKLIAAQLDMQESTVKVHVRSILKKLHAANRTHAASVANRLLG